MSAFIVSDQCMQRVVHAISKNARAFSGMSTHDCASLDLIGAALYAMNQRAMAARYPNDPPADLAIFRYRPPGHVAPIVLYKAIICLLYQCGEGNVPNESLYRDLEAIGLRLAESIVGELAAYQAAPWD